MPKLLNSIHGSVKHLLIFAILTVQAAYAEQPNVILVITDDQGYGDLSCHGNPILKTPALDKLYSESIRLTDFHVTATCAPTRGALMSGHFTNRAGPWHTIMGRSMLFVGEKTLGEVFADNGYATGMFGASALSKEYIRDVPSIGCCSTPWYSSGTEMPAASIIVGAISLIW